ncbi:hypothetical protein C4J88_3554 [Pseudomonas sp. R4-39-08]|nr:hypothetical protein C4J88_3554 [Pseudomonas sp. R4-39-08]
MQEADLHPPSFSLIKKDSPSVSPPAFKALHLQDVQHSLQFGYILYVKGLQVSQAA